MGEGFWPANCFELFNWPTESIKISSSNLKDWKLDLTYCGQPLLIRKQMVLKQNLTLVIWHSRTWIRTAWLISAQEGFRIVCLIFLSIQQWSGDQSQPHNPAHAHHGLILRVCSHGLIERWQHRVYIALRKAPVVLLSGAGGLMEYFLTLKKLTFSFHLSF